MRRSFDPAAARRSRLPRNDEEELELDKEKLRVLELELSGASPQQRRLQALDLEDESERKHMDLLRTRHMKTAAAEAPITSTSRVPVPSSPRSSGVARVRSSPSLSKHLDPPSSITAGNSASSRKLVADVSEPRDEWGTSCLENLATSSRRKTVPSPGTSPTASPLVTPSRKKLISNATDPGSPAKSPVVAQQQGNGRRLPSLRESDLPSMADDKFVTRRSQLVKSRSSPSWSTTVFSSSQSSKSLGWSAAPSTVRLDPGHGMPSRFGDIAPRSEIDRLNARLEGMQADMKADMKAVNAQRLIDFLQKHDLMSLHEALVKNGIDGVHRLILMDSQQLSALMSRCNADGMDEITLLSAVRDMQNFPM